MEYVYSKSNFVHQIFITCVDLRPLVCIVVPDYEVVYQWTKAAGVVVRVTFVSPSLSYVGALFTTCSWLVFL